MSFPQRLLYYINVRNCRNYSSYFFNKYFIFISESMAPEGLKKNTYLKWLVDKREGRRVRRQIASECCNKPCTIANIIEYCPGDSKLMLENSDLFE